MLEILVCILFVVSANYSIGWCPTVDTQKDFDYGRYMGVWHQEIRDKGVAYENGICNIVEYSMNQTNVIKIKSSELIRGKWNTIFGSAYCKDREGHCQLRFFDVSPDRDYKIVMTDYDHFSIVYMCTSYLIFHTSYAWVLTREVGKLDLLPYVEVLERLGIKGEDLLYTDNNNCPLI